MIKCRLNALMGERDLKQKHVVEATGVQPMTISKACRNELKEVPVSAMDKLCSFFNCQPSDIWQYIPDEQM